MFETLPGIPVIFVAAFVCPAGLLAQSSDLRISPGTILKLRQLSPLSTSFNRKGDLVSATILDPPAMKGGFLEGEVLEVRDGREEGKGARLEFEFQRLHLAGQSISIAAAPLEVTNSRGLPGVDESGTAIEGAGRSSGGKLASLTSRFSRSNEFRLTVKASHLTLAVGAGWRVQIQPHNP